MLMITVLAGVSLVSGGLGFLVGQASVTPLEAALVASPPEIKKIAVPVERGRLVDSFALPAELVEGGFQTSVSLMSVAPHPVVTARHARVGDELENGQVLIEIADRPIFAFHGPRPAFRDLFVGDAGKDVAQLQTSLTAIGLYDGDIDGFLGPRTAAAIRALYSVQGFARPLQSGQTPVVAEAGSESPSGQVSPSLVLPYEEYVFVPPGSTVASALPAEGETMTAATLQLLQRGQRVVAVRLTGAVAPLFASAIRYEVRVVGSQDLVGAQPSPPGTDPSATADGRSSDQALLTVAADFASTDRLEVVVTIAESGPGALLVPSAALSVKGNESFVHKAVGSTDEELIEVRLGVAFGGLVELVDPGTLEVGDLVLVPSSP